MEYPVFLDEEQVGIVKGRREGNCMEWTASCPFAEGWIYRLYLQADYEGICRIASFQCSLNLISVTERQPCASNGHRRHKPIRLKRSDRLCLPVDEHRIDKR